VRSRGQRVGEGVLYLGHCVYTGLADDARCRETGKVPLRTDYLRDVVGRHHLDDVRNAAQQIGYVERDPSYRAGSHSQSYWILPPYDCAPLVRWPVTSPALRNSIRSWHERRQRATWDRIRRNETPVDERVCSFLWRNLQRIEIDADIDRDLVQHMVGGPLDADSLPTYQVAVEHLRQGDLWFTVDDYGRIHTNLTNLPKMLRRHLSVEGERLVNVDIGESQPLFFGLALAAAKSASRANPQGSQPRQQREAGQAAAHHMLDDTMMDNTMLDTNPLLAGGFDRQRLPSDLRRYLELCEGRAFYQTVADRLGKTRDQAKRSVMVVLFDKPWHRNATCAVMEELFPSVMRDMRAVKRQDYRRLAHFAQRVESAFMFGRVVPRLMELPDLFVGTIHDSIMTTSGHEGIVQGIMLEEFGGLGVHPTVRVER